MNQKAYLKAKIDLYNITANLAYNDYVKANYNKQGKKYKKHHAYTLSEETEKAKELYDILFFNTHETLTLEQEEKVKSYLLQVRIFNTELLKDRGGNNYFSNSLKELELQTI